MGNKNAIILVIKDLEKTYINFGETGFFNRCNDLIEFHTNKCPICKSTMN